MTLEQLRTLSRIVECGSLKIAAESLHKTQPALSMAIKKLEAEYGFEILDRQGYRLTLTPAGKAFYRKAQELLLNAEELSVMGRHLGAGNEPLIRLAYDYGCHHPVVTDTLKQCHQQYPDTAFNVVGESRFGALELLMNNKADLAITPWWPTLYTLGEFDFLTVANFKVVLVAAPSLFGERPITNSMQLGQYLGLAMMESQLSVDSEQLTLIRNKRQWKFRDAAILHQMVLAGMGWALVPDNLVANDLRQGTLVKIELDDMESCVEGELRLVRKLERPLGPVGQFFWQTLADLTRSAPSALVS